MLSVAFLEVYGILIPEAVILFLAVFPLSFISLYALRFIALIETPSFHGLTFFLTLALVSLCSVMVDIMNLKSRSTSKGGFYDISMQLQSENKRLRLERNIYIHLCVTIGSISLKKMASLATTHTKKAGEVKLDTSAQNDTKRKRN